MYLGLALADYFAHETIHRQLLMSVHGTVGAENDNDQKINGADQIARTDKATSTPAPFTHRL